MKQTNVIDYMPAIHERYPELDPKGLNALVTFFFRQIYAELSKDNELHLQNLTAELNTRIHVMYQNPEKANKAAEKKRWKKLNIRKARNKMPQCKPGEKFRFKRKPKNEKPENS